MIDTSQERIGSTAFFGLLNRSEGKTVEVNIMINFDKSSLTIRVQVFN